MDIIRKADVNDVELLSFLAKETYRQAFAHTWTDPEGLTNYITKTFNSEVIADQLAEPGTEFYIVQLTNEPVGYFKFTLDDNILFLSKMYFLQKAVGQQLGTQCMAFIDAVQQKLKLSEIRLEVLASNEKGIRFYQRNGFREIGQKENYTVKSRGNLLIMKK